MDQAANVLNNALIAENQHVYDMLSDLGKSLYYPKGILSQSAEAKKKAYRYNATIGIATEGNRPMYLPVIQDTLSAYEPEDLYTYAPPAGKPELRSAWKDKMISENPSLQGKSIGEPIVTNALTHGLSIVADLFVDQNDPLIVPDKYWGNYKFVFGIRRGARIQTYPLFNENQRFHAEALREAILKEKDHGKAVILLNFPNNPTGYTPTEQEAESIVSVIEECANLGMNLVVMTDDAYFQLFYEDSIKESLFAKLAGLHDRVLAIKIDGATKEEFVWGFRVGFITYASSSPKVLEVLEEKTKGIIRGTISSASHPSQTFILKAIQSPQFVEQKNAKFQIMKKRANKVKEILLNNKKYNEVWSFYPFNSGYFMCLKLKNVDAEKLRVHLLENYGVGTVSINSTDLRIAFSCVEEDQLEDLFELIYQAAKDLS
ncbi:aminotransferase class I/II-fold pyridoxal phosphate-dependent enzyme [Bacillus smithii]|uniref:aminotransferase class I/II-fold pyridoxal phosphate-dependent enzyme n=1 Tax=Bacillus smithii TaxID=1479 RepID=UPI0030C9E138